MIFYSIDFSLSFLYRLLTRDSRSHTYRLKYEKERERERGRLSLKIKKTDLYISLLSFFYYKTSIYMLIHSKNDKGLIIKKMICQLKEVVEYVN